MNGWERYSVSESATSGLKNSLGTGNYPIHRPIQRHDIKLPLSILSKRADAAWWPQRRPRLTIRISLHEARAVVAIQILPDERGDLGPAVHVAAGDRTGATRVRVLEHRQRQAYLIA